MLQKEELTPLTELVEIYSSDRRGMLLQSLIKDYLELKEQNIQDKTRLKRMNNKITSIYITALLTIVLVLSTVIGATTLQVAVIGVVQLVMLFSLIRD